MSSGYKIVEQDVLHYVTFQVTEDYLYSSARYFAGKPCLLDILPVFMQTEKIPIMRTVR